jgi:hypothetical protein
VAALLWAILAGPQALSQVGRRLGACPRINADSLLILG